MTDRDLLLIHQHAQKEFGHALRLLQKAVKSDTSDDWRDTAQAFRQVATRCDSLAELEREEAVR